MPELPEVETVRRGIESIVTGQTVLRVQRSAHHIRGNFTAQKCAELEGKIIQAVQRRAKYLLLCFSTQEILMIHLGMSGQLLINPLHQSAHDHLCVELSSKNRMVYRDPRRFGMLSLYEDMNSFEQDKHLVPDGTSPQLTTEYMRLVCNKHNKNIKALIMDQRIISGIGNIYASEILFSAKISPFKTTAKLSKNECEQIALHTNKILQAAINAGGTSLKDHTQANGKLGYFQQQLNVYNKAGNLCNVCQHIIDSSVQEGRTTFYCPQCQKVEQQ